MEGLAFETSSIAIWNNAIQINISLTISFIVEDHFFIALSTYTRNQPEYASTVIWKEMKELLLKGIQIIVELKILR